MDASGRSLMTPADVEPREDLSAYEFSKFAATYFVNNTTYQFSRRKLKSALLDLPAMSDQIAAQVN